MNNVPFKGCPYPIEADPLGYLRTQWGIDQIKSDILILLLTNPGERVMLPTFGTPLKKLFFEPNDAIVVQQARQMIIESIRRWEPRIALEQVKVFVGTDQFDDKSIISPDAPTNTGDTPLDPLTLAKLESQKYLDDETSEKESVLGIQIRFFDPQDISNVQELVLEVPMR